MTMKFSTEVRFLQHVIHICTMDFLIICVVFYFCVDIIYFQIAKIEQPFFQIKLLIMKNNLFLDRQIGCYIKMWQPTVQTTVKSLYHCGQNILLFFLRISLCTA